MNIRTILHIEGVLISVLSASMILPMMIDAYTGHANWKVFFVCTVISAFFGNGLILSNRGIKLDISTRGSFVLTNITWVTLPAFAALPFLFSDLNMSATDSFFEAMSGITTTGSTVITKLENASAGILLWRAILQWLGGIGIIIMAMSVMPFLNVGGMQIFKTELPEEKKILPRSQNFAHSISVIYGFLTAVCALCYMIAGLSFFDSIIHAMTTISTGGFSTSDGDYTHFRNIGPSIVAMVFMTLSGIPFLLYIKAVKISPLVVLKDTQVRWYFYIIIFSALSLTIYLTFTKGIYFRESSFLSLFNVISIITGTGYANGNISNWGGYATALFLCLMAIGGCAGSTVCGIKIFRFQILYKIIKTQIKHLLHPNGLFIPHYNKIPLSKDVPSSVMGFLFVYALAFATLTIALTFTGLDFTTAFSGAISSISNVGPRLGEIIGPASNFQPLPNSSKWLLCIGMFIGRLEIFTILIMFSPRFWKY